MFDSEFYLKLDFVVW